MGFGKNPYDIDVDYIKNIIYVSNQGDDTVSVINGITHTVIGKPIPVGKSPMGIAVDPGAHRINVANSEDNTVSVINGENNTVMRTIPIGNTRYAPNPVAIGIYFDIGGGHTYTRIYVANSNDNTVSVINGTNDDNTVIGKPIPVGTYPVSIDVDDGIYVANLENGTVSVINPAYAGFGEEKFIAKPIPVGGGPASIRVDFHLPYKDICCQSR